MPSVPTITAPVTQAGTPAVLVVASEIVTVVVPVKFSKPDMVCRDKMMDWPLMLSVISEGPEVASASMSEDMGGVKLPDAVADDIGGGVMIGNDGNDDDFDEGVVVCNGGEDDMVEDSATLYMLVVALEVPAVDRIDVAFFPSSWLLREAEMLLDENDEKGKPLEFELNCEILEL